MNSPQKIKYLKELAELHKEWSAAYAEQTKHFHARSQQTEAGLRSRKAFAAIDSKRMAMEADGRDQGFIG